VIVRRIARATAGVFAAVAVAVPAPAWADPAAPAAAPAGPAPAAWSAALTPPDSPLDRLLADRGGQAAPARQQGGGGPAAPPRRVADLPRPAATRQLPPAPAPGHPDPSAVLRVPGRGPPAGAA
jgi:DNA polymerase III subunit gamma/tau